MDTMDGGDMYLNYLTSDKPHCDTETNVLPSETEGSLEPIETMFADISDGNMAWTIDGYSVLMNPEQTKDTIKSSELPSTNSVLISNEPLLRQLHLGLPNGIQSSDNDNNFMETNNDPIINGSAVVMQNQVSNLKNLYVRNTTNVLKNCRSILKTSALETVNITDMMDEVTAFNCRKCGFLSRTRQGMIDHVKSIHFSKNGIKSGAATSVKVGSSKEETIVYLCGVCGKVGYNSRELLRQHMINVHEVEESDQKSEQIPPCRKKEVDKSEIDSTPSNNILRDYELFVQNQQKSVPKVRCSVDYCESRFTSDDVRQLHEKCHSDYPFPNNNNKTIAVKSLQDYKYKCTECDMRFVMWKTCASHLWTRHRVDIGLYSCPMCIKFKSISPHIVSTHISTVHLSSDLPTITTKPCLCNICGARYKSLSQLRTHIKRTHLFPPSSTPPPTFPCPTCHRECATSQSLRKHQEQMHTNARTWVCAVCNYRTTRKDSMDGHVRGHTGEKPFGCGVCGFRGADRSTVRRHEMRHLGVASYSCPHCAYTSIQSGAYKKHLLQNHPGEGGVYTCSVCSAQYLRYGAFTAHMRNHSSQENAEKLPLVSILRSTTIPNNLEESDQEFVDDPEEQT